MLVENLAYVVLDEIQLSEKGEETLRGLNFEQCYQHLLGHAVLASPRM